MKILFLGDIVGRIGRKAISCLLPQIKTKYGIDFVIANGENVTHGHGMNHSHYLDLLSSGIDVFTSGNHFYNNKDVFNSTYDFSNLIRPYNFHKEAPLVGTKVYEVKGKTIRVTNLIGMVFLNNALFSPFDALEEIVNTMEKTDYHIVDFHAEATGEKKSLAFAFDGQVTAVIGTHTHVPTNDFRLLPKGTAYISDVGMCGAYDSVLGDSPSSVIPKNWKGTPSLFTIPEDGTITLNSVIIEVEDGKAVSITPIIITK